MIELYSYKPILQDGLYITAFSDIIPPKNQLDAIMTNFHFRQSLCILQVQFNHSITTEKEVMWWKVFDFFFFSFPSDRPNHLICSVGRILFLTVAKLLYKTHQIYYDFWKLSLSSIYRMLHIYRMLLEA